MTTVSPAVVSSTPSTGAPAAAAANGVTPFASASLYVGDLNPDVTEALLFEIFNAVGPVASVRVCRDAQTRRSLGYAYVNFHRVEDAERALDIMNFKPIRNRPCRIMWSHRDPSLRKSGLGNIFINHLASSIDNKQLYDTFSVFGNILSCKVAQNSKRESLGYGFVHYEAEESANSAIAKVDGKVIAGEKVSVSLFKSKKERGGANKFKYTNIFIKNLPGEYTSELLSQLFSKFGTVTSVMVNSSKDDKTKSFGFVNFQAPEEASAAVEAMNNQEVDGKKLYVARAQKKEEREKELREKFEQLKQERQKKYAGVNLYVKNLSDETDDEKLSQEFSKYGAITSAKIMKDGAGKSKGFGFVCFQTPEDATKAVTELNGRMLDNKPLYVALAQRKELRRAQLEAQYAARAKIGPGGNNVGNMAPVNGAPLYGQQMMFQQPGRPQQAMNYMYPQMQGGVPRWNPQQQPQMMLGRPGQMNPINYQLMPVNARVPVPNQQVGMVGGAGQRANANQRGNRGNARNAQQGGVGIKGQMLHGAPMQSMVMPGQPPANQHIRYAENVRNRGAVQAPNMMAGGPAAQPAEVPMMPAPNEPLTIKALAAAPEEMRKQMIGERLFPLIKQEQPTLAGKITGMLLEMDNGELIHLLESQAALHEKIQEAIQVLNAHPAEEATNEEN